MKKYLVTQSSSDISDYLIFEAEDFNIIKDHVENKFIKDHAHTKLSKENFIRYFKSFEDLLRKNNSDYIYYYEDNQFTLYKKGAGTDKGIMKFKIWEDFEDKTAIVYETDVQVVNTITEKVYKKMLENIDKLRVLYNEVENSDIDYTNQFNALKNYEFAGFSNDLLDYNDFDYSTGEVKEVTYLNGSSNNESPLELIKIDHNNIKAI